MSRVLGLVCGLFLGLQPVFAAGFADEIASPIKTIAPDFTRALLMGGNTLTLSQLRGKVVYLDFWDSWCGPCRESFPAMSALRDALPRDDFEVVAVNLDADPWDGRRFIADRPVSFPVVSDPQLALVDAYALKSLPTAFLLDRNGVVRSVHRGFKLADMGEIEAKITALMVNK